VFVGVPPESGVTPVDELTLPASIFPLEEGDVLAALPPSRVVYGTEQTQTFDDRLRLDADREEPAHLWHGAAGLVDFRDCATSSPFFGTWFWLATTLLTLGLLLLVRQPVLSTGRKRGRLPAWRALLFVSSLRLTAVALCLLTLGTSLLLASFVTPACAAESVPQRFMYNGRLLNAQGAAITTTHSLRLSLWNSTDAISGDVDGVGNINTLATTYAGWQEVHAVTPDASGYFSVEIGGVSALPDFAALPADTLLNLHLQVEVKAAASPNTAYELLDIDAASTTRDRTAMLSVPFALNARFLNQRQAGTGSGDLALLGPGGLLAPAQIPAGTTADLFTIDIDDTNATSVGLQFGTTLAQTLTYDIGAGRFSFSDDLHVVGNITVTGLVDGVDVSSLASLMGMSQLSTSTGAGLTINVSAGRYQLNGLVTPFAGGSGIAVADNATNYVFFGSGGLIVNTSGVPLDESSIPVAEIVTSGGVVTSMVDTRVLFSDDREQTVEAVFHPEYEGASYEGDGTDNVGQLYVRHDDPAVRNAYVWTTTRATQQDYDVILRLTLPSTFVRWSATPLEVQYLTSSGVPASAKVDISMLDTTDTPVSLLGGATDLTSVTWSSTNLTFNGSPIWAAGEDITLRIKLSALAGEQAQVSRVRLQYVELH
jgi:hypothetical protein